MTPILMDSITDCMLSRNYLTVLAKKKLYNHSYLREAFSTMSDNSIPKPVDFLLNMPLYTKITFVGMESWSVVEVLYYAGTYDSYCLDCQRDSIFQVLAPGRPQGFTRNLAREKLCRQEGASPEHPRIKSGMYTVHSECTRQTDHTQDFLFFIHRTFTIDGER